MGKCDYPKCKKEGFFFIESDGKGNYSCKDDKDKIVELYKTKISPNNEIIVKEISNLRNIILIQKST